jgi:hypothetical protein
MSFQTNDDQIKALIAAGFLGAAGGVKRDIIAKAANYTIDPTVDPCGSVFTNRGASGTITLTLPAPSQALKGYHFDILTVVAQIVTLATTTADTLITDNDATADSLSTAARIGVALRVLCDGTSWIAILASAVPQSAFAQTGTVAT